MLTKGSDGEVKCGMAAIKRKSMAAAVYCR